MCRWTSRRVEPGDARRRFATSVAGAFAALALSLASSAFALTAVRPTEAITTPARVATEPLFLGVTLNGVDAEGIVTVLQGHGQLALPVVLLEQLNLRLPESGISDHDGERYAAIGQLRGLTWRIDEASQMLVLEAAPSAFARSRVTLDNGPSTAGTSGIGGYANYDLQWQRGTSPTGGGKSDFSSALVELGGFHDGGSLRTTGLVRETPTGFQKVRLETAWTHDVPAQMASLRIGDSISRAGAWGRAVRFGGVQWSTDFSTQPGFLTFPLPGLQGEAALPSTVDVYVNNTLRLRSQVPAGPFDLTDLPIVTGQGQVRMVVRDLLGREQVVTQPYYVSPALLRPGLRSYAYELGVVREDFGVASAHYGRLVSSVTDKRGISEHFTLELRAETIGRQLAAGATGIWALPMAGTGNASLVHSKGPEGAGAMAAGGIEYQGASWSGSVQARATSRHFSQTGQQAGPQTTGPPRSSLSVAVGSAWAGTSFGVSYVQQRTRITPTLPGAPDVLNPIADRTKILSLNASRQAGVLGTLNLFVLRDLANRSTTLAVSLSRSLGPRDSVNASTTRNREAEGSTQLQSVQVQRSLPEGSGIGWQLSADRGDGMQATTRTSAQGTWQTDKAVLSGGIARNGHQLDTRLGASGGVAMLGDSVFAARRIDGSFAVVDVGGYADVQVLHDNRPVGRTDASGRALVANLRGYEPNRIGVEASDLPFDAEVDKLELVVVPPARSGTAVFIPVARSRAASFRLLDADGKPVPPGSSVHVAGSGRAFPVGFDGRAFVSGLAKSTKVQVSWPGSECTATLELNAVDEEMPELGSVRCVR